MSHSAVLVLSEIWGGNGKPTGLNGPFRIVNTSMLRCATLNNNEVVALVDRVLGQGGETPR